MEFNERGDMLKLPGCIDSTSILVPLGIFDLATYYNLIYCDYIFYDEMSGELNLQRKIYMEINLFKPDK